MESNDKHWGDAIDSLSHPSFEHTEGAVPPTNEAVDQTRMFLRLLRVAFHCEPPTLIIPMNSGGILSEANDEHKRLLWDLEVHNNGEVHFCHWKQKRGD